MLPMPVFKMLLAARQKIPKMARMKERGPCVLGAGRIPQKQGKFPWKGEPTLLKKKEGSLG